MGAYIYTYLYNWSAKTYVPYIYLLSNLLSFTLFYRQRMSNISGMACWSILRHSLSHLPLTFLTFRYHYSYDTRMAVVTIYLNIVPPAYSSSSPTVDSALPDTLPLPVNTKCCTNGLQNLVSLVMLTLIHLEISFYKYLSKYLRLMWVISKCG